MLHTGSKGSGAGAPQDRGAQLRSHGAGVQDGGTNLHPQSLMVLPRTNIPPVGASLPAARVRPAGPLCRDACNELDDSGAARRRIAVQSPAPTVVRAARQVQEYLRSSSSSGSFGVSEVLELCPAHHAAEAPGWAMVSSFTT